MRRLLFALLALGCALLAVCSCWVLAPAAAAGGPAPACSAQLRAGAPGGPPLGRAARPVVVRVAAAGSAAVTLDPSPTGTSVDASDYRLPLSGPPVVVHRFSAPADPYAAGHRGVDLRSTSGQAVYAAAGGTVTYASVLAGRGVVVVRHPDGLRTEYEPITIAVRTGQAVLRGQLLGHVSGTHPGCLPGGCLHWGARRGAVYVDPLTLLLPLGPVSLLPWLPDG